MCLANEKPAGFNQSGRELGSEAKCQLTQCFCHAKACFVCVGQMAPNIDYETSITAVGAGEFRTRECYPTMLRYIEIGL